MQIKIAFKAIFLVDGGILAGGTAKCTPKRQERYRGPRRARQQRGRGTEGNSRGNPRALNSQ